MADPDAERLLHEFCGAASTDVTMSLLRSPDALPHLALMAAHLGDGKIVDGETLTARINEDLPRLRRSFTSGEDDALLAVHDGDTLVTRWTKRGWVYRTVDPDSRIERYQLTSGAEQAIRQVRHLRRRSTTATESALAMVMAEIRQIAMEANPDIETRRAALTEQITMLEAQRNALDSEEPPQVDQGVLVDKVSALVQLIDRMPGDIARYGERMQANTVELIRRSFADDPAEFADSLQRMFEGHDVISESPEGLAFRAFATFISTPSQCNQLESDVAEIVGLVDRLPAELAETLTGFVGAMWNRVQDVEGIRRVAFRRGGDVRHYRSMHRRINEAQAAAVEAFRHTHGGRDIGFTVPMSGVDTASVGRLRLDEGRAGTPDPLVTTPDPPLDLAALVGRESIDWAVLRAAINTAMERHGGYADLHDILGEIDRPRVGDVIGVWSLASQHGQLDTTAQTTVVAHTARGAREITLPYLLFGEPIANPLALVRADPDDSRALGSQNTLMEVSDG
ncbi:DUF3375 family protein [Pseudonocardia sp.]|uniref:DUF3375 family protein n=1 Tax=Pseudonocardia sp. TaxID=60912 RepID=UPI003D14643F